MTQRLVQVSKSKRIALPSGAGRVVRTAEEAEQAQLERQAERLRQQNARGVA